MSYSQNQEDLFVLHYFGTFKGTLLEIGANDGVTLSNSKLLIENGWRAHLLEPGDFDKLLQRYPEGNENVFVYNYGIGNANDDEKFVTFYQSGSHILNGSDHGLVSTCDYNETIKWRNMGVEFTETKALFVPFDKFYKIAVDKTYRGVHDNCKLDFISIDAEGYDWVILQQIDLNAVGCRCLCIEWNSDPKLLQLFTNYCAKFGMKEAVRNAENLIFTV